jgi:hypothetical protein
MNLNNRLAILGMAGIGCGAGCSCSPYVEMAKSLTLEQLGLFAQVADKKPERKTATRETFVMVDIPGSIFGFEDDLTREAREEMFGFSGRSGVGPLGDLLSLLASQERQSPFGTTRQPGHHGNGRAR